jgi:serine/threonine protein kinase
MLTHIQVEVVQKELRSTGTQEQDYEREQHILSLLRCLQHPNIVQFYTAYTLNQKPTLLFAPADCNLAQFLSQPRPPSFESDQSVFQALYGLSSAISHVHNYFSEENDIRMVGCHYDLKPKNVLVKQNQFILADFGISRLKSEEDGSLSGFKAGISDYFAPECQNLMGGFEKNRIGRRSDVWSFGCILAEIATYIEFGPQGVVDFSAKRKITFQGFLSIRPFHAAVEPSKAVMAWLNELEARESTTGARLGLLTLIHNMLAFHVNERPNSLNVSARLFLLAQRAAVDLVSPSFALLQQKADYGFRVECERFKIWCESVGIPSISENGQASTWFLTESARAHFEVIRNALQEVVKELSLQAGLLKLEPTEPCNSPTYYVLRKHVDALWNTQPLGVVRRMTSLLENSLLRNHAPEALFHDAEAKNDLNGYRRIQLLIAMRQAMTSVDAYKRKKPQFLIEEPMKLIGEISGRQLAYIGTEAGDQRSVLVEVLEYQDKWVDRFDELLLRVDSLVSLLSKPETSALFPMLPCINFCHLVGRQAFGLLYGLPTSKSNASLAPRPITLVDLIRQTQRRSQRPLLEEVFTIAHTLASSVLEFHKAGWLHKGISSFNLIFFPEATEPASRSITSPYLIGFNHSRRSNNFAFTEGPCDAVEVRDYQHPEYRHGGARVRFREEFDYYSVGIILMELGQWKALRSITRGMETLSAHQIRNHLLQEEVPVLGSYMGKLYRDAVEACISGKFSNEQDANVDSTWTSFERKVVEPLFQVASLHHDGMTRDSHKLTVRLHSQSTSLREGGMT